MKDATPPIVHADPNARSGQNRLQWGAMAFGAVAVGVGLVWLAAARAPVAIHFEGIDSSGVHLNPYGRFTVENLTQRAIDWSVAIEAPLEPNLRSSQVFDSLVGAGRLQPGETTPFRALVAGKQGVPFRAVVTCHQPALFPTRLWLDLSEVIPLLKRVWSPTGESRRAVYSQWWSAPSDYRSDLRTPGGS